MQPSPYTAMKKLGSKASKLAGGGTSNPSPRGSSTSKKQSNLRYDSQKNLLHRLGGGASDEPPKFSHHVGHKNQTASSTNSIFSPKTAAAGSAGFGGSTKKNSGKRQSANMNLNANTMKSSSNVAGGQAPIQINSL